MKRLDRHIGSHVVWGTALALFVLMALFTLTEFVDDLDSVGRGEYTLMRAFQHLALKMPGLAFELFPIAALIGSLIGLGLLAGNLELTVIRAAGVSSMRITGSVMKAAGLLMVIVMLMGELVVPSSERLAEQLKSLSVSKKVKRKAGEGFWMRDGSSFINVRRALPEDEMADVYVYEFDGQRRLRVATRAQRAQYHGGQWILEDLRQSLIDEQLVKRRRIDKAEWASVVEPGLVDVITVAPESLSVLGLYKYLGYLRDNNLSTKRYELAMWSKLVAPFATGVMIFLSIPLVLGRLGSVGIGQRLLVGILVGMSFYVMQQVAAQSGIVYGLTPLLSAVAPTLLFFGVGAGLMRALR